MYAENAQISHRQLFRQIVTGLLGIYILIIPAMPEMASWQGILSLLTGTVVYLLLCTFFVRIKIVFQYPERYFGKIGCRIFMLFYISWLWLMGCYLLLRITRITQHFLVEGSVAWSIIVLAGGAAYVGSHQGLERRARMAEVCFPVLMLFLAGMFFLGFLKINPQYLCENGNLTFRGWKDSTWKCLCLFLPFSFLPITLGNIKKPGEARGSMGRAMGLITAFLILSLILLQGSFGWNGYEHKRYPLVDCMSGVRLPGRFLERVDVFWIVAVLFSVLFSLGSVFFYQHELLMRAGMEKINFFTSVGIVIAAIVCAQRGFSDQWFIDITIKYYGLLFFILFLMAEMTVRRKRLWKKVTMFCIFLLLLLPLSSCGVSLEDRVFPLSMSVDYEQGNYKVIYGIPQLTKTTENESQVMVCEGKTITEAEENFKKNQQNYLDMGHIKVCILGNGILKEEEAYENVLNYLENNPAVAGNIYVFSSNDLEKLMSMDGQGQYSIGNYLSKLLENNRTAKKERAVQLQDLYNAWHRKEPMPKLPFVTILNNRPQICQYS